MCPFKRALVISAGGFRSPCEIQFVLFHRVNLPVFFGYYFILIKNSIDLNGIIAGKIFQVITFYWWLLSFSFFIWAGKHKPGILMVGKLKILFLICNMLYSRILYKKEPGSKEKIMGFKK
jgi:hypothetical protein